MIVDTHGIDVPDRLVAVLERLGFENHSYSNDVCPHWGMELGKDRSVYLEVWCDYPDPSDRELPVKRFSVMVNIEYSEMGFQVYETESTDDLVEYLEDRLSGTVSWTTLRDMPYPLLYALANIPIDDTQEVMDWLVVDDPFRRLYMREVLLCRQRRQ